MTCETLKTTFETRHAAEQAAKRINRRKRSKRRVADRLRDHTQAARVYRCPFCAMWHLGRTFG